MLRIGAVAAGIRNHNKGKPRKRSRSDEELELLKKQERTVITDIDIRENTKTKLRFRKLPWTEWFMCAAFLAGAIFIFVFLHMHDVKKLQ